MKNRKKQKNKTGQFNAVCVKLSNWVLSAVSVIDICFFSQSTTTYVSNIYPMV